MPVKNSEAYSQTLQELESDIVKQEQEQQLSAAEILKRKRAREAKRLEEIRAAAAAAFELEEAKRKQEEEAAEERRRKKREHEARKAREAAEFEERELERKTKPFFKLGRFNKHVPTGVVYFGDHIMEGGAWVPHGYGEFRFSGNTIFEGDFFQGEMHGLGALRFDNDDVWKGTFRHDDMHGYGVFKYFDKKQPPRESIYRHSRLVCWLDELVPGTRVRMHGLHRVRNRVGTIVQPAKKRTKFQIKFDLGEMLTLDLAEEHFEVVRDQPRCAILDTFPLRGSMEVSKRYSYALDQRQPATSTHEENFFNDEVHEAEAEAKRAEEDDKQRYKDQTTKMQALLAATAEQNRVKAELAAGQAAEQAKREQEAAEAAAYEATVQAQREALTKKREEESARMAALKNNSS